MTVLSTRYHELLGPGQNCTVVLVAAHRHAGKGMHHHYIHGQTIG